MSFGRTSILEPKPHLDSPSLMGAIPSRACRGVAGNNFNLVINRIYLRPIRCIARQTYVRFSVFADPIVGNALISVYDKDFVRFITAGPLSIAGGPEFTGLAWVLPAGIYWMAYSASVPEVGYNGNGNRTTVRSKYYDPGSFIHPTQLVIANLVDSQGASGAANYKTLQMALVTT